MKLMRMGLASLALVVLVACQTLGVPNPTTFNERLAAGYTTVTTVRSVTTDLLQTKVISSRDAQNVQNQAENAREGLDVARDIHTATPAAGEDKLKTAQAVLQVLQKYLATKRKGGG